MPVTLNLKKTIDLPIWQWLRFSPVSRGHGSCLVTDKRGIHRFIYMLLGTTHFIRYNTWTDSYQYLASPPSFSFAAGVALIFDPSRGTEGYIWLSAPLTSSPWHRFAYYDIATNTWTSRAAVSGLTAAFGTDASLAHTCSAYNVAGNDDYIYLIGNNSTKWYRYSISGNAWTEMSPVLPASAGAGCHISWAWAFDTNKLFIFRGAATTTIYVYLISEGTISTLSYVPANETFSTGSQFTYDGAKRIYCLRDNTTRMFYLQLDENKMYPAATLPMPQGTAIVGDAFVYIKSEDGAEFLYTMRHSGTEFWRMLIGWF